jgi:hypothetical protein
MRFKRITDHERNLRDMILREKWTYFEQASDVKETSSVIGRFIITDELPSDYLREIEELLSNQKENLCGGQEKNSYGDMIDKMIDKMFDDAIEQMIIDEQDPGRFPKSPFSQRRREIFEKGN